MSKANSNTVRLYFAEIGIRVALKKAPSDSIYKRRHFIEYKEGGSSADRLPTLLEYYFVDVVEIEYGTCAVFLDEFNEAGHGDAGTCKKCGCTQNDACVDTITGSCYWVTPDLCSACATDEEKQAANGQFEDFFDTLEI